MRKEKEKIRIRDKDKDEVLITSFYCSSFCFSLSCSFHPLLLSEYIPNGSLLLYGGAPSEFRIKRLKSSQ
jgi:hypothetical protein